MPESKSISRCHLHFSFDDTALPEKFHETSNPEDSHFPTHRVSGEGPVIIHSHTYDLRQHEPEKTICYRNYSYCALGCTCLCAADARKLVQGSADRCRPA